MLKLCVRNELERYNVHRKKFIILEKGMDGK